MIRLFKQEKQDLDKKYKKLAYEACQLSLTDKKQSDHKMAEADEVMKQIVRLKTNL